MAVLRYGFMGGQLLQPDIIVMMKSGFVIVNKNGCRDVHGVNEHKALFDPAFLQARLNLRGDVDKCPTSRDLKP
jgi:hypothetical protein